VVVVSLIGILEYAARTLPLVENRTKIPKMSELVGNLPVRDAALGTSYTDFHFNEDTTDVFDGINMAVATVSSSQRLDRSLTARAESQQTSTAMSSPLPSNFFASTIQPTLTSNPNAYIATSSTAQIAYVPTVSTSPIQSRQSEPTESAPGRAPSSEYLATTTNIAYVATITQVHIATTFNTDASGHLQTILSTYTIVFESGPTSISSGGGNLKSDPVTITWPLWWVFAAGYLPLLLAILVKIFWTSVYFNVKLVEPFIQLSNPNGALASDVLFNYYLSSSLTPDTILALLKKRWILFWTSFVSLVVGLLAPLASEVLFLDTHYGCGTDTCWPPKLSANRTVLRLLQGLLSFIAIMTLNVMVMLYRSTTGLYSNPSSIASIASLLHHPEVLGDFKSMSDEISSKELKIQLGSKKYQMGVYARQDGVWRYGIIPAVQSYSPGWTPISLDPAEKSTKHKEKKRTHHISTAMDIGFGIFILGVLGVVVAYFIDGSNSGFNRFFNSNTFGPRFFMVCVPGS
jgi:hypothetical protein